MIIFWNDGTSSQFKKPLDQCDKRGEMGFYNINMNNKPVLILWTNINYIQLQP
jgi:hypothetical protein